MGYKYQSMVQLGFNTACVNLGVNAMFKIQDVIDF